MPSETVIGALFKPSKLAALPVASLEKPAVMAIVSLTKPA